MLLLLGMGTLAGVATGAVAYWRFHQSTLRQVEAQLTGVRRSKAFQVESYFRNIRQHVLTLSQEMSFVEGANELEREYSKLNNAYAHEPEYRDALRHYYLNEYIPALAQLVDVRPHVDDYLPYVPAALYLQNWYIIHNPFPYGQRGKLLAAKDESGYSNAHRRFHDSYRRIGDAFGYTDLMLLDLKDLAVVYSVQKLSDFGTSLTEGPYRETALARVAKQCRDSRENDAVYFTDFQAYEPSRGAPAAFVCSPIADRFGTRRGILAIQLGMTEIDRAVSGNRGWERDGLGKTGDSGIVGADYLLRSTARGFQQDPKGYIARLRARGVPEKRLNRIVNYGTTALQQEVRLPSVERALRGEEGVMRQKGSSGEPSIISYGPLRMEGLKWTFATRMDETEALASVRRAGNEMISMIAGVLALMLVFGVLISRRLVNRIQALADAAKGISRGDLSVRVPTGGRDELSHLFSTFNFMADSIQRKTAEIEEKNRENESLLLNILPSPVAARLKGGESVIADHFADVTVLFADLVGFTVLSGQRPPDEIVNMLNDLFRRFDAIAHRLGIEKIKTIGDAYMAVAGLPTAYPDHARRMAEMALNMIEEVARFGRDHGLETSLRIGLNSGPVVAGVIGSTKFIYDLWGDTVNIASRMESHGMPGAIQLTRSVYEQLKNDYEFEYRGEIEVKGKGPTQTWMLLRPSSVLPFD